MATFWYACIASDSLVESNPRTIDAQSFAKREIDKLFSGPNRGSALFAAHGKESSTSPEDAAAVWQCRESPEGDNSLIALQNCNMWFLFTDGKHENSDQDNFARRVARLNVDNYPCVIVLLACAADGPPSSTRYKVCTKTYNHATNALFLFTDVAIGESYVFGAKGCFATLGQGDLTTDEEEEWRHSRWSQLARFRYTNLVELEIPDPKPLSYMEQLTIHNRSVLTRRDYANMLATKDVGEKFDLERIQEIIKTADKQTTWRPLYIKPRDDTGIERVDIGGKANHAIDLIFFNLDLVSREIDVPESRINEYRTELRAANDANRAAFRTFFTKRQQKNFEKAKKEYKFLLPIPDPEETFFPGFVHSLVWNRENNEYRGTCQLCHAEDVVLVLLLHDIDLVNADLLLTFPLRAVFDDSLIVCDACAVHFPTPNNHLHLYTEVVAALPLVSLTDNEDAWTDAFGKVTRYRIERKELLNYVWRWFNTWFVFGGLEQIKGSTWTDALTWVFKNLELWESATQLRRHK